MLRMRIACWITKATDTHSEYVIIIAFPVQQWLLEQASKIRVYEHRLALNAKHWVRMRLGSTQSLLQARHGSGYICV